MLSTNHHGAHLATNTIGRRTLIPRLPSTHLSPLISHSRQQKLAGLICHTRGNNKKKSGSSNQGSVSTNQNNNSGSNETFQQLRQAVLSSLDFSDSLDASQEWDDSIYDSSAEDLSQADPHAATAASVGKAVYETLRIDKAGKTRRVYVRRRDLIRSHGLQPRDLRRVDPSLSPTKTSPSVTIKEECVLINIGGVRAVITADRCLLFEPTSSSSRRFVESVIPRLHSSAVDQARRNLRYPTPSNSSSSGNNNNNNSNSGIDAERHHLLSSADTSVSEDAGYSSPDGYERVDIFPFELEILEAALMIATGKLEGELVAATRRVGAVLQKLPREITPVNLEELRRVKQILVELESKAENLRDLLEELMDDEDEVRELNLSSRPKREEKRRQREREKIEREMEREWGERGGMKLVDGLPATTSEQQQGVGIANNNNNNNGNNNGGGSVSAIGDGAVIGFSSTSSLIAPDALDVDIINTTTMNTTTPSASSSSSSSSMPASTLMNNNNNSHDVEVLDGIGDAEIRSHYDIADDSDEDTPDNNTENSSSSSLSRSDTMTTNSRLRSSNDIAGVPSQRIDTAQQQQQQQQQQDGGYQEAQDALEEMMEEEEEERELEEVEDLLEYYLQRAATTQSEAERLLAGARDLEESIGVSLSARRFEVNRLELLLSMASFAAALGAMVASIFGMNLRSTLEMSVIGFWGTTAMIVAGSMWVFWVLYKYTKGKRIL